MKMSVLLICFSVLGSCGKDRPAKPHPSEASEQGTELNSTDQESQISTTVIPTGMQDEARFFDFDSGKIVEVDDSSVDHVWDIGVQFYFITSNGGMSGPGGVLVSYIDGADFNQLSKAPSDNYLHDVASQKGNLFVSGLAFLRDKGWFTYYMLQNHRIEIRDRVYFIRSSEGRFFKIKILSFSKANGKPGDLKFSWKEVEGPEEIKEVETQDAQPVDISMDRAG